MAHVVLVQGCPVFNDIGPYIAIVCTDANAVVDSIYRGDAARRVLNANGKHTQRQLFNANAAQRLAWGVMGTPDAPGHSTHELFSDGRAYPDVPDGCLLDWWQQGFDVNAADADAVMAQAAGHGWRLFRPYSAGVELHHLNFMARPSPTPRTLTRIYRLRHTLPTL